MDGSGITLRPTVGTGSHRHRPEPDCDHAESPYAVRVETLVKHKALVARFVVEIDFVAVNMYLAHAYIRVYLVNDIAGGIGHCVLQVIEEGGFRRPEFDIELSMAAGFNGARLHQKAFEERFYYWADKLGYLTWGEAPSWGMDANDIEVARNFLHDCVSELALSWPFTHFMPPTSSIRKGIFLS